MIEYLEDNAWMDAWTKYQGLGLYFPVFLLFFNRQSTIDNHQSKG